MNTPHPTSAFDFLPVSQLDPERIERFAREVWPGAGDRKNVLESWWMTTGANVATAAVDRTSGRIAGLCVGVPSAWDVDGASVSAVSICNWFVSPAYMGRGLGKQLVQSFAPRAPFMNAFSVSDAAIENFRKLGWIGPYRSHLLLFPAPLLRGAKRWPNTAYSIEHYRTDGSGIEPALAVALDQIEHDRPPGALRQKRRSSDWQVHLAYFPERRFDFSVIRRDGHPIGYFAIRQADRYAGPAYRRARLHYVSDLVINSVETGVMRQFLQAIVAAPAVRRAGAVLLCTSDERIAAAASEAGWWSHRTPVIGPKLAQKAPLYMKGDGFKEPAPDGREMTLTFFDSDVDLNI